MPERYIITEDDQLLRRIPLVPSHIKEVDGKRKPSSAAFKTKQGEDDLSVDVLRLTTLETSIPNRNTLTGAIILASLPISLGYDCKHDPIPSNNAHALIV